MPPTTKLEASKKRGLRCPIPGCRNRPTDWHHTLKRRPDHPYLQCDENMTLVCHEHHVPEAPDLGYHCMIYKFTHDGITPEQVEAWARNAPFRVPITLPPFYDRAKEDVFGWH